MLIANRASFCQGHSFACMLNAYAVIMFAFSVCTAVTFRDSSKDLGLVEPVLYEAYANEKCGMYHKEL